MPSPRISLTRNITNAHTLEELKTQIAEFASRLEDYLNAQIGIHFLSDNKQRPTLITGDLYFDFTQHPQFATLQQWNGQKLIPLDLGSFGGFIDLIAQGIGSGTDASLFLRSDGAGRWVLAAGPVGPAGPVGATGATGADGDSAYQVAVNNGFVGTEADWLLSLVGATGAPGAPGADGADGADGSVWYNGSGVPGSGLGIDGDYYVRTTNGDVYFKSSGAWAVILNIMGPAGAAGAAGAAGTPGANGSTWYNGSTVPASGLGVNGDYYIRSSNGDVYFKAGGTWSVLFNIIGPTGATGPAGADGNANVSFGATNPSGAGTEKDIYVNTINGDVWFYHSSAWNLYGANAYRLQGKGLDSSVVAPTDGFMLYYDATLFSGIGGWKAAAPPAGGSSTPSYVSMGVNPVFL